MAQNEFLLPLGPIYNSELFSNYWLNNRLPLEPDWHEFLADAESALTKLQKLWKEQRLRVEKYGKEAPLEEAFIQPVLEALGWKLFYQAHIQGRKPDYALFTSDEDYDRALTSGYASPDFWSNVAVVGDAKAWHISLDKPTRIDGGSKECPPVQMEWYLDRTRVEWGLLTNGRLWRLTPQPRSFYVGIKVSFCIVMREDLVVLDAFFHEAKPPALSSLEVVFDPHRDRGGDAREAEDHHADQCTITKADDSISLNRVEELPRLFGAQHRSFPALDGVFRPTDRRRGIHRQNAAHHQIIEEHPDRRQVLLYRRLRISASVLFNRIAEKFDVPGNDYRIQYFELEPTIFAPIAKFTDSAAVRNARIFISDVWPGKTKQAKLYSSLPVNNLR